MSNVDRWLLPDGIGDALPEEARRIEKLRRELLDLFDRWGYDLIIPPLLEFTESLLVGNNRDLDLQTFKVMDQISGRMMGIRADITPQAARIDAHSLNREGPVRLCYAGSVLHTRQSNALASRSPIQLGAECFGIQALLADIEVISLMIETLSGAGLSVFTVSLGHAGIFRALVTQLGLDIDGKESLLDILQRKAASELQEFLSRRKLPREQSLVLGELLGLHGDATVLSTARKKLASCPVGVLSALAELEQVASQVAARYHHVNIHVDLAEMPGFQYHNGVVFAAYADGAGAAIANGGRYDDVGAVYGRVRPATGFNADLRTLMRLGQVPTVKAMTVAVVLNQDAAQWESVRDLRERGIRVITIGQGEICDLVGMGCTHQLVPDKKQYVVKPL